MASNDLEDADRILNEKRRREQQAEKQRKQQAMREYESYNWKKAGKKK